MAVLIIKQYSLAKINKLKPLTNHTIGNCCYRRMDSLSLLKFWLQQNFHNKTQQSLVSLIYRTAVFRRPAILLHKFLHAKPSQAQGFFIFLHIFKILLHNRR